MKRASNFELLRIVAMIFVVLFHISLHAQHHELASYPYITGATTTGVNLFILISGYFGIKLKWRSLLNMLSALTIYSIISVLGRCIIFGEGIETEDVTSLLFPMSDSYWWFAKCYMMLMLLSPAINLIIEKSSKKQMLYIIGVLAYLSCITGYVFKNSFNVDGFCIFNFVFVYIMGGYLRRHAHAERIKTTYLVITHIACSLGLIVYHHFFLMPSYNNPVLLLASLSLFMIFMKMKDFSSPTINSIAQCMFAVYLLHDSPFGFSIYEELYAFGTQHNFESFTYIGTIVIYAISVFALAIALEKTRLWLMSKPIERASNYLKAKCNIFDE